MSEISFQAVAFTPRFVSVLILVALSWLIAKFAMYMVKRAACAGDHDSEIGGLPKFLAKLAFWSVFILMSPFISGAAGIDTSWLMSVQNFEGQVFANWPLWMVLSLVVAGIWFVVQGVPKFFTQLKGSLGTSKSEVQS